MTQELEKVDLRSASEQLVDKIKLSFTEVISDEQWKALIENELKKFTTEKKINQGTYHARTEPSGLSVICEKVFKEAFEERLKEYMKDLEFASIINETVKAWLVENQANMVKDAIMSMLTFNLTQVMRDMTQNAIYTHEQDPSKHSTGY